VRVLLIILAATRIWAQPPGFDKPVFKIDGLSAQKGGAAELLQAVCPGKIKTGADISCSGPCPEGTAFPGDDFTQNVTRVTRGHFLSASSDDALLALVGCESHSSNFGGSTLLTRQSGEWKQVWYKPGMVTDHCRKVVLRDQREVLVCERTDAHQGVLTRELYVIDALRSPPLAESFFGTQDTVNSCGGAIGGNTGVPDPSIRAYIERVEFYRRPAGLVEDISVFARYGRMDMTPALVDACTATAVNPAPRSLNFVPPTKAYRINFLFVNGRDLTIPPGSVAAAKLFDQR
jgi:hypothetical protein